MGLFMCSPSQDDDMVRVTNWQRAEQNDINEAENGRVGADAEGEREYGDGGEAWRFAHHA